MKKILRFPILILMMAALAGGAFWIFRSGGLPKFGVSPSKKANYYCPMHPSYTSDRPGDCPICNMKLVKREASSPKDICYLHNCPMMHDGKPCPMLTLAKEGEQVVCPICKHHVAEADARPKEKKILFWTDPMIPGYKSDKPGKSPMGMDLIPVYEEETPAAGASAIPEGYTPIIVAPQKQQLIGIQTSPVKKMPMTKTIRTVGRIAYDPELYQAEEEYVQAVVASKKAEGSDILEVTEQASKLADSAKIKLRLLGLSDELIKEVGDAGKPDRSLLYSETGGTAWLYAPIYEYEIPLVKVGDKLDVEVPAVPGKNFQGTIRSIDSVLDRMTRSVRIRAVLDNLDGILKPEMYVNATLQIDLGEVLGVPEQAVFATGEKNIIFVAKGEGVFEPRDVALGAKSEDFYEIKTGVAEGELVVTSGNFLIDSESRLKAALQGLGGGETHQHGQ